jgi:hypothetical protein
MIVASIVATVVSVPSESIEASASHTVIVRPPHYTTRAISSSPRAAARRLVVIPECGRQVNRGQAAYHSTAKKWHAVPNKTNRCQTKWPYLTRSAA